MFTHDNHLQKELRYLNSEVKRKKEMKNRDKILNKIIKILKVSKYKY